MLTIIFLSFFFLCFPGVYYPPSEQKREINTRIFEYPYSCIIVLQGKGYTIQNADPNTGIINTDYRYGSGLLTVFIGENREKVSVFVREIDSLKTEVVVDFIFEIKGDFFEPYRRFDPSVKDYKEICNAFFSELSSVLNSGP